MNPIPLNVVFCSNDCHGPGTDQLSTLALKGQIILDIDMDFFYWSDERRVWISPVEIAQLLSCSGAHLDSATLCYSVTSGYLPFFLRYLGDWMTELLAESRSSELTEYEEWYEQDKVRVPSLQTILASPSLSGRTGLTHQTGLTGDTLLSLCMNCRRGMIDYDRTDLDMLRKEVGRAGSAECWTLLGYLYLESRDFAPASDAFERALALGLDFWDLRRRLAQCWYELGSKSRSLAHLRYAYAHWPDNLEILSAMAEFEIRQNRLEEARIYYIRLVQQRPLVYRNYMKLLWLCGAIGRSDWIDDASQRYAEYKRLVADRIG